MIVDDHKLFAESIRVALEGRGMDVVGVAGSGAEAIVAVAELDPDVILMDIGLPDQSGLAVGRAILDRRPHSKILALTALNDGAAVAEAMQVGFRGYLTKETPVARFIEAITAVLEGRTILPHRYASVRSARKKDDVQLLAEQLSGREREVLQLLAAGASGAVVAERLAISRNTVRTHVQSILTKLQVHSRLEAATFAVKHGLVDPAEEPATPAALRRVPV